jgi:glutamyl-tRNA reductase
MPTPLKKLSLVLQDAFTWTNQPLSFRIGFLGLGLMGSGIVSNLLKMGHTVTVWNRTAEKVSIKGEVYQALESGVTEGIRHLCLYSTFCTQ